ncbi:MAG: DUF4352 domain-containing protein [Methanoregula sp.]|nr:DUF4352 domain-containing protein [Methanoregula sp.]
MQKNIVLYFISFVCIAMILVMGCTSSGSNPVATVQTSTPIPIMTTSAATITTTAPLSSSIAPTSIPTAVISATQTPVNAGVSVTINSAVKKTILEGATPNPVNIFLVLDVTLQNNDKNEDFSYTDSSFTYFDKKHQKGGIAITSKVAGKVNNAITSGVIPLKSKTTGQIVFGVPANSRGYKFSVIDSKGTVITTIDNLDVP